MYNKSFLQLPGKLPDADPKKVLPQLLCPWVSLLPPPPHDLPPHLIFQNCICAFLLLTASSLPCQDLWSIQLSWSLGGPRPPYPWREPGEERSGVALPVSPSTASSVKEGQGELPLQSKEQSQGAPSFFRAAFTHSPPDQETDRNACQHQMPCPKGWSGNSSGQVVFLSCHPVSSQIQIRAIPQAPNSAGQNRDGALIIHSTSTNMKNI